MTPPRIAIVMRSGKWRGGAEWMLWHLLEHQTRGEVNWLVVFLEDGQLAADVRDLGIETHVFAAGRLREPWRALGAVRSLRKLLDHEQVELVVGWMADSHIYAGPAASLAGVPAVWYQLWIPAPSWVDRLATRLPARGILACSDTIATAQRRLRPHRPVQVVHPGVDLRRFDPSLLPDSRQARRELGLPEDRMLIGIVGRLERWKGTHVLIEAMPTILRAHPNAHCVTVGEVHERDRAYGAYLQRRIQALGLADRVTMAGAQPNPELWMAAMDIVVHASDSEPFGIVVLEALALGKPLVAGGAGGPTEVITDGVDGLLTPYDDRDALAAAVVRLLDDPAYARELARAGQRKVAEFSSQAYAEKMVTALTAMTSPSLSTRPARTVAARS